MMKHIISLLCLFISLHAMACGPYDRSYLAEQYNMFRLLGDNMTGCPDHINTVKHEENCQAWQQLCSKDIPLKDISEVIYQWDMDTLLKLKAQVSKHTVSKSKNQFARWLVKHQDKEIVDYLILAKKCELIHALQKSAWYYPVDGDDESVALHRILKTACKYKGKRLKDRYTLQALRALFFSRQYSECLNYWLKHQEQFQKGIIRDMATGYAAGAYHHVGNDRKASEMYLEISDFTSYAFINEKRELGPTKKLEILYKHNPDTPRLLYCLQHKMNYLESQETWWNEEGPKQEYQIVYKFVNKVICDNKCEDMAPWYYTRAFLAEKYGQEQEAKKYIKLATQCHTYKELADAIRVLRIHIDCHFQHRYNLTFEKQLYRDLQWLDKQIVNNLTPYDQDIIRRNGINNHICGYSQYYWSDMMRRIIIGEIAPLCIRSGYRVRALQYLNMADNRIFRLVPETTIYSWHLDKDGNFNDISIKMDWKDYRSSPKWFNSYDYSNDLFVNLDSLGVDAIQDLIRKMEHPTTALDTFLLHRSYDDVQYFREIAGTQLIAAMRYKDAMTYLKQVSVKFNRSRNINCYYKRNPFAVNYKKPDSNYKLHFAQRMVRLEDRMNSAKDPNDRAEAMLFYVRGLQSSINRCWPLTSYYWGEFCCYPFHSQYQQGLINNIERRANELKEQAFTLFTNDERAAHACYRWNLYRTAAKQYPNTHAGRFVKGHCDKLIDYK